MARKHYRNNHRRRYHYQRRRQYTIFERISYFSRKHRIAIGVILIIASIVLFRLSFTNTFLSSNEVFMWSMIISVGLFIAGLFTLVGWWRNNILQHRVGLKIGHWR